MKQIYIAAPFFNPNQLARVARVEHMIGEIDGLSFYSPRSEGILSLISSEEAEKKAQEIYDANVSHIDNCDALLAILDDKDTGTSWELGYATGLGHGNGKKRVMGFHSDDASVLNLMLSFCLNSYAAGWPTLHKMLCAYAQDKDFVSHYDGSLT